jgi:hypothetical protein
VSFIVDKWRRKKCAIVKRRLGFHEHIQSLSTNQQAKRLTSDNGETYEKVCYACTVHRGIDSGARRMDSPEQGVAQTHTNATPAAAVVRQGRITILTVPNTKAREAEQLPHNLSARPGATRPGQHRLRTCQTHAYAFSP